MVVFDAGILLLLLSADVEPPLAPDTQRPVDRARDRIDHLVSEPEASKTKIIVPTPALSEILVKAGTATAEYLSRIDGSAAFRIAPFDTRAAVEVALMTKSALDRGNKRDGGAGTHAKIKYDRQIIAIARTEGVTMIYSDDNNIRSFGARLGLTVIRVSELPLPPEDPQEALNLVVRTAADEDEAEEDS
jgi:predicted nucleic acid-binding protein